MEIVKILLKELEQEAQTTRKFLQLVPQDHFDWQPHPKSMSMIRLATHIAELPTWITMALTTSELDFAKSDYQPHPIKDNTELMQFFENSLADGRSHLEKATEEDLLPDWTMRNGDQIYSVSSRLEVIRMSMSQIIHHRAQLGVYLRLLNIPIPGSYGPSADETDF
jgi:uncharacterized damage-inducible protein DinB